jgi:hypothetical protein
VHLNLGQQRLLDFPLNTPKHERPQDLMQLLDDARVLLFNLCIRQVVLALEIEPLIEVLTAREHLWQKEI